MTLMMMAGLTKPAFLVIGLVLVVFLFSQLPLFRGPELFEEGPRLSRATYSSGLRPNARIGGSLPSVCLSQEEFVSGLPDWCRCLEGVDETKPWSKHARHCGLELTSNLLLKAHANHLLSIEILEEVYRPISYLLPSKVLPLSKPQNKWYYSNDSPKIEDAEAGRCWLNPSDETFKCLPSLIIIGFQRASTRELYDWLAVRNDTRAYKPRFARTNAKANALYSVETHYFDSLPESRSFHDMQEPRRKDAIGFLNETWATVYLASAPSLRIEQVIQSRITFEKTPAYMDETDPTTIRDLLPSIKLIALLRQPDERLYSAYWRRCIAQKQNICSPNHFVSTLIEPAEECGLKNAMVRTEASLEVVKAKCMSYFESGYELRAVLLGFYGVFLQRYADVFRTAQSSTLFIAHSETLREQPFELMQEVEQYLGVGRFDYSPYAKYEEKVNAYVVSAKSKALQAKPSGYVPFSSLDSAILARVKAIYSDVPSHLQQLKSSSKGLFLSWSKLEPGWLSRGL